MSQRFTHIFSIAAVIMAAAMLSFLQSCEDSDKKTGPDIGVRDSLPTLQTIGVSTLISDSGIIRYKMIAEEWYIYDKKVPPHWSFEKGLFVERFNPSFQVDAFISCDTAYFYNQQTFGNFVVVCLSRTSKTKPSKPPFSIGTLVPTASTPPPTWR